MKFKVAILMEPIELVKKDLNSSYALLAEGLSRGHRMYWLNMAKLVYESHNIYCDGYRVVEAGQTTFTHEPFESLNVNEFDIIIYRMDPPIDMNYITLTFLFERLKKPYIVSNPFALRNSPEKIPPPSLEKYFPPFIISNNFEQIKRFHKIHKEIVLKPLYGLQGEGIVKVEKDDVNILTVFKYMTEKYKCPIIAQKYLEEVKQGCNRIILIDGKICGSLNILPGEGDFKIFTNGKEHQSPITPGQLIICKEVSEILTERKILMAGLDFIKDNLLEINITSPGCIQRFKNTCLIDIASIFWDALERKRA